MNDRVELKNRLQQRSSEELQAIYKANDRREWQTVVFEIIPEILTERGMQPPSPQQVDFVEKEDDLEITRYNVLFDGIFASNQFGFVREGEVAVCKHTVVFEGKVRWSISTRCIVFLLITVLPYFLFGFAFGILPAAAILGWFCTSPGTRAISRATIRDVQCEGRQIQFYAKDPQTEEIKKAVFVVDTIEHADAIVEFLSTPNT